MPERIIKYRNYIIIASIVITVLALFMLPRLEINPNLDLGQISELIKKTAYKVTRVGELIGREVAENLKISFGVVDLSLAPTPNVGDSVGEIFQSMGLKSIGVPGTTAALAMLNDAVKKGGAFASTRVGGLSGAFGGAAAGSSQTAFGARTGDVLTMVTIGIFIAFLLTAVFLNYQMDPSAARPAATIGDRPS